MSHRKEFMSGTVSWVKARIWGDHMPIVLLNGHPVKQHSKHLCLHLQICTVLSCGEMSFFETGSD